jgi:hypothetical protein
MQRSSFIFRVKQSMKYFGLLGPEDKVIVLFDSSVVTYSTARRHSSHDVQLQHWLVWTLLVGTASVLRVRREAFQFPILAAISPQRSDRTSTGLVLEGYRGQCGRSVQVPFISVFSAKIKNVRTYTFRLKATSWRGL